MAFSHRRATNYLQHTRMRSASFSFGTCTAFAAAASSGSFRRCGHPVSTSRSNAYGHNGLTALGGGHFFLSHRSCTRTGNGNAARPRYRRFGNYTWATQAFGRPRNCRVSQGPAKWNGAATAACRFFRKAARGKYRYCTSYGCYGGKDGCSFFLTTQNAPVPIAIGRTFRFRWRGSRRTATPSAQGNS